MLPLQHVEQLMDNDVFKSLHRFLGKLQVNPDTPRLDVAAPPLGFHLLDAPAGYLNTHGPLPLLQERLEEGFQLLAIPAL